MEDRERVREGATEISRESGERKRETKLQRYPERVGRGRERPREKERQRGNESESESVRELKQHM